MKMIFNLEPLSLNVAVRYACLGKGIRKYKSDKAKDYERSFKAQFRAFDYKIKVKKLLDKYDRTKHGFKVTLTNKIPNLYTKQKTISKKSQDLDNCIKYTLDCLFYELGIDDSQILEIVARKQFSEQSEQIIKLELIEFTC